MTEPGREAPDTPATYVFAVCRGVAPAAVAGLRGVSDEGPVRTLPLGTLTAVLQTVRAAEFTDEVWQARLSDPHELERYARAHHDVVSAVAVHCPTVPLPLTTVYLDDERTRQALTREADRFRTILRHIAHHAEWGVKVYASAGTAVETGAAPAAPAASTVRTRPAPGAGLAYLDRKRGIQQRREQHRDDALRIAEVVDAEVRQLATAFRRLRPHAPQLSGERDVQVLNATYLLADRRADELALLTQTLRERTGARIELSGPWVPYSFVGEV
jgi:hypothetical protein